MILAKAKVEAETNAGSCRTIISQCFASFISALFDLHCWHAAPECECTFRAKQAQTVTILISRSMCDGFRCIRFGLFLFQLNLHSGSPEVELCCIKYQAYHFLI